MECSDLFKHNYLHSNSGLVLQICVFATRYGNQFLVQSRQSTFSKIQEYRLLVSSETTELNYFQVLPPFSLRDLLVKGRYLTSPGEYPNIIQFRSSGHQLFIHDFQIKTCVLFCQVCSYVISQQLYFFFSKWNLTLFKTASTIPNYIMSVMLSIVLIAN